MFEGAEGGCQLRFLKRQLSLLVSTISQWWVTRSSSAAVILGSPNTVGHSPKARFVEMITLVRSSTLLLRWMSNCPPERANGRQQPPSTPTRPPHNRSHARVPPPHHRTVRQ